MKQPFSMTWHQFRSRHYTKRYTFNAHAPHIWVCVCGRIWRR